MVGLPSTLFYTLTYLGPSVGPFMLVLVFSSPSFYILSNFIHSLSALAMMEIELKFLYFGLLISSFSFAFILSASMVVPEFCLPPVSHQLVTFSGGHTLFYT